MINCSVNELGWPYIVRRFATENRVRGWDGWKENSRQTEND